MHLPIELDRDRAEPLQNQLYEQLRGLIIARRLKSNSRLIATRFPRREARHLPDHRPPGLRTVDLRGLPGNPPGGRHFRLQRPARSDSGAADQRQSDRRSAAGGTATAAVSRAPAGWGPFGTGVDRFLGRTGFSHFSAENLAAHHPACAGVLWKRHQPAAAVGRDRPVAQRHRRLADGTARHRRRSRTDHHRRRGRSRPTTSPRACSCNAATAWSSRRRSCRSIFLFESLGATQYPVAVDEHGILVEQLPEGATSLAYVTPSHQNPIGGTLPMERREGLIEWARSAGAYLIEDDCDGDFRYRGMGPPSLKSLDPYGLVLYTGTFSKTLGAGPQAGLYGGPAGIGGLDRGGQDPAGQRQPLAGTDGSGRIHRLGRVRPSSAPGPQDLSRTARLSDLRLAHPFRRCPSGRRRYGDPPDMAAAAVAAIGTGHPGGGPPAGHRGLYGFGK